MSAPLPITNERLPNLPGARQPRVRSFHWRALVSVTITVSFAFLLVSGIGLWFAPPGRVANWTDWTILGLRKHDWADLHIWFAVVFAVASGFHLLLNWRPLVSYFRSRLTRTFSLRLEWTIGLILCGVVFAGTRMGVPPFSSLLAFTEDVRGRWEARAARPPVAHAELLTLSELAAEAGFDLANALTRLEARKITGAEPHARVEDVAKQNGLSAQQLYDIMSGRSTTPADSRGGGAMRGRSGGFGQRTLADFCEAEGIDLGLALSRLEDSGLHGSADQTIREITVNAGLDRPNEVLQIIREGR